MTEQREPSGSILGDNQRGRNDRYMNKVRITAIRQTVYEDLMA